MTIHYQRRPPFPFPGNLCRANKQKYTKGKEFQKEISYFCMLSKKLWKLPVSRVDYQKECWCWCLRSHYCGASVINSSCHRWATTQSIWLSLYGFFVFKVRFQNHHHWVFTFCHSCSFPSPYSLFFNVEAAAAMLSSLEQIQ